MEYANVFIVDSKDTFSNYLSKTIKQYYHLFKIENIYEKVPQSIDFKSKKAHNIVFVDFEITNECINLLIFLQENNAITILIVDNDIDALQGFKYNVLYCIKKPLDEKNIATTFNKIYSHIIIK